MKMHVKCDFKTFANQAARYHVGLVLLASFG